MKKYAAEHDVTGASMAATVSGANTNFDRLRYISERTEIGERREAVLSVTIPERPGAFKAFCHAIGKRNGPSSTTDTRPMRKRGSLSVSPSRQGTKA